MERTTYMQKKRKGGFTLAEFLVVIAITTILAGVSFVAAIHYQSRLRRLEMDQTAKEIFGSPEPVEPGKGRWKSGTASGRISGSGES